MDINNEKKIDETEKIVEADKSLSKDTLNALLIRYQNLCISSYFLTIIGIVLCSVSIYLFILLTNSPYVAIAVAVLLSGVIGIVGGSIILVSLRERKRI